MRLRAKNPCGCLTSLLFIGRYFFTQKTLLIGSDFVDLAQVVPTQGRKASFSIQLPVISIQYSTSIAATLHAPCIKCVL